MKKREHPGRDGVRERAQRPHQAKQHERASERSPEEVHRLVQERLKKVEELRQAGINPYPYRFDRDTTAAEVLTKYALAGEERSGEYVHVAGRVVLLRKMGKVTFGHLQDGTGRVQFYAKEEDLKEAYEILRKLDMGDFLGIRGEVFATKTGEITVHAASLELLAKSLRPLPEKHHGLQDVETRYRKRYLDLIVNPHVRQTFLLRSKVIKAIRNYLDSKGLLEVETPVLQPIYGGANAKPFTTHHNALDQRLFLRISDELYLKRLLVGGFDGVYEISKDFRNEGIDTKHNPEFTMLEWYLAYADYNEGMRMVEELVTAAAVAARGTAKLIYQGKELDLTPPWRRATMAELIDEATGLDVLERSEEQLRQYCHEHGIEAEPHDTWGIFVQRIFEYHCEGSLWDPVIVTDYPVETTPLCKEHRTDKRLVERFEVYIAGMEIANAYSELNDPVVQRAHLQAQVDRRKHGDEEAQPMDEEFIEALEYGMPPTSGVGVGVDRIVMLITDSASIRDVILFPAMKPQEK